MPLPGLSRNNTDIDPKHMKGPTMPLRTIHACVLCVALFVSTTSAQPLTTAFTYQGELWDSGSPATGPHDFRFRLYDAAVGGGQVGPILCADEVSVTQGFFTLSLDFGSQFSGQQRFLEIEVRADSGLNCSNATGFTMLVPRQSLTGTPNSIFSLTAASATSAINSRQLNGQFASFYQNAANLNSGIIPDARLSGVYTGLLTLNNSSNTFVGWGTGLTGLNASNITTGTLSTNRLPVPLSVTGAVSADGIIKGTNDEPTGSGVRGYSAALSGYSIGVHGESNPSNPTGTGVVGAAQATGGWFEATGPAGTGLYGIASNTGGGSTDGMHGRSAGLFGVGVRGVATHIDGVTYGGRFESYSTAGVGAIGYATATSGETEGVFGRSDSPDGRGVFGLADSLTGTTYGGRFESRSGAGTGVYGLANATSGYSFGVQGGSASTSGRGVHGFASADSGLTIGGLFTCSSTSGKAVYGWADAVTGSTYGVYGKRSSITGVGYAVFAEGDLGASGFKSFRIDHPEDPENKYLLHYSTESSEVLNAYSGSLTLDGRGQTLVELPRYFAAINRDPRYTLTAIGAPMPNLHVAEKISAAALRAGEQAAPGDALPLCVFRIAGGAPGGEVCWRVEALRNDLRMRLHGAPVEAQKTGPERGKYQHPEYYGKPAEKGMDYDADRERASPAVLDGTKR